MINIYGPSKSGKKTLLFDVCKLIGFEVYKKNNEKLSADFAETVGLKDQENNDSNGKNGSNKSEIYEIYLSGDCSTKIATAKISEVAEKGLGITRYVFGLERIRIKYLFLHLFSNLLAKATLRFTTSKNSSLEISPTEYK